MYPRTGEDYPVRIPLPSGEASPWTIVSHERGRGLIIKRDGRSAFLAAPYPRMHGRLGWVYGTGQSVSRYVAPALTEAWQMLEEKYRTKGIDR